ncbi:MAG: ribbon-helix-helix domain-containing protein [Alphaproteobacteria bacterium]|nr:ribbon-helix-helix domain-containing protein [Alphaproteobacteria bacterium]
MADTRITKRSVMISGHATSVSLEAAFWDALKDIARARGQSVNALIGDIDRERGEGEPDGPPGNLSSAIRVFVLRNG